MDFHATDAQRERRREINDLLVEYTSGYFDADGSWVADGRAPALRERLWYAHAYLGSDRPQAHELASAIVQNADYSFCHFAPMGALRLLRNYGSELRPGAVDALDAYLDDVLREFAGEELDFVGLNDNFPTMSTFVVLVGGAMFDDPELREIGRKRLGQYAALFRRRGVPTEFTSPTYTPIQLFSMAALANNVEDADLRERALACEERLWVDVLSHYHEPTSRMAGPYSRAYTVDSAGHTHQARYVLYALLGDDLAINPTNTLFSSPGGAESEVIHHDAPFMQVSTAWLMGTDLHCRTELLEAMLAREFPRTVEATFEYSSSADPLPDDGGTLDPGDFHEYPAGSGTISTYATENYALGIASDEFLVGSGSDSFHLLYCRDSPAERQADVATVYSRYVVDDDEPGQHNEYPRLEMEWAEDLLRDRGRNRGHQHENTGLLVYHPRRYAYPDVESMKLSLLFPAHYGPVEEIWLGDERVDGYRAERSEPCPVYVKDGPVYVAFHPLALTDHGRDAAVRIERPADYVMASFYNYEGEPRTFEQKEFTHTANGFVVDVRDDTEVESFAAFRRSMAAASVSDRIRSEKGSHLLRTVQYDHDGRSLGFEYSPIGLGVKYATVDGTVPDRPKLAVSGVDTGSLPFM